MFSNFKAAQPKTVESVLSQFNQVCKDLEEIQEREKSKVASIETEIYMLNKQRLEAEQEAIRAAQVMNNIRQLTGGKSESA
jgi:hypothetical protein